jgi:ubiquitin thioesterase OTU1
VKITFLYFLTQKMRLKAKTAKGQILIGENLQATSTVQDILKELEVLGYSSASIKTGFPPKSVSTTLTLQEANIRNGDVVIVVDSQDNDQTSQVASTLNTPKVMVLEMKDDNSCLFRSIGYLFLRNQDAVVELRRIVSKIISADPINFSDAILGKSRVEYCRWIEKQDSWGGAIELLIFSDYFKTEITSIDVSTGRMDRFGEGKYHSRAFVIYSGIHYDAIVLTNGIKDREILVFGVDQCTQVEHQALQLAAEWKRSRKFTDLASFTLKCATCFKGLIGQKDAQKHALQTGHSQFSEY